MKDICIDTAAVIMTITHKIPKR